MNSKNEDDVYRKLQQYLDTLPIDHPETASGADLKVLKHLYTPQEAEIALRLKPIPLEPKALFRPFKKKGWTLEQFSDRLLAMAKKGSIRWYKGEEGENYFGIVPLVLGSYDYQIDMLTKEFAEDMDQFLDEGYVQAMLENGVFQLRYIPIEKSIPIEYSISNYDEIKKIIDNKNTTFFLSPCICRQSKDVQGNGCNHPKETCLTFGRSTRVNLNQGREVSKEEALKVLRTAQEMGMVLCPGNAQDPEMICCCCGCSCLVLENLKKFENPVRFINSNYFVSIDEEACSGCGTCVSSCHMDANKIKDNRIADVDLGYCIGCGVCVPACPENARKLIKKQEEMIPPKNFLEMYQAISQKKSLLKEKRKEDSNYNTVKKVK
jgi:NAD-dependent dihydropyrimidine dehydrogenase PreA subunit